jgi:hypothetical protein
LRSHPLGSDDEATRKQMLSGWTGERWDRANQFRGLSTTSFVLHPRLAGLGSVEMHISYSLHHNFGDVLPGMGGCVGHDKGRRSAVFRSWPSHIRKFGETK